MSSYGNTLKTDTFEVKDVFATDVHSSGTIYWTNFSPAIGGGGGGGGSQNLATTLATGNDANNLNITNLNDLECVKVEASEKIETPKCEATLVEANQIQGSGVNPAITGINNIATNNIAAVSSITCTTLTASSQVNSSDTVNGLKGNFSTSVTTPITDTAKVTHTAPVKVTSIQMLGDIDLQDDAAPPVRHNINNVNTINATAVNATGVAALQSSITVMNANNLTLNGTATGFTGELNMNVLASGGTSKIDFTGLSGVSTIDTFLEGDKRLVGGNPIRTKASYLDLTDGTNLIPLSEGDYRWGVYFAPTTRITIDYDDRGLQVFNENCFFLYSSTLPEHSNMIFEANFFIEEYGYGDIQLSITYQPSDGSSPAGTMPNSQMFYVPEESATAFRSVRKVGQCHASWLVTNMPTDGREYKFWIAARTDFDDNGRMIVSMRQNGGNPDTESERGGPVMFQCYPKPSRFRIVN